MIYLSSNCNHRGGGCNLFVIIVFFLSAIFPVSFADAETPDSAVPAWIQSLHDQGWDEVTATEVVHLNQDWFAHLAEKAPQELDEQLARLGRLGKYPQFSSLLQKHPELAGLLAGSEDPRLVAKTLSDEGCYPYLTQQYSLQAAPDDALALAKALERHGETICKLAKRGVPGASALFIFPHETVAGKEYARWLDEVMRSALSKPDDELAERTSFLITEGGDIRRRMERDPAFRDQFRVTLWPRLVRTVQNDQFSVAVAESLVWDLLMLPQGEALLKTWGPEVPANLLFGEISYPKELHETVITLMVNDDQETVNLLMRFAGEPALYTFLQRGLPWDLTGEALKEAAKSCPEDFEKPCPAFLQTVNRYNQMTDEGLSDTLKPEPGGPKMWIPFVSSYYVAKKMTQGREVSAMDVLFLGFDIATVAVPIGKVAGGILKGVETGTTRKIGENMASQQLKKYSQDQIAKQINPQFALRIADHKLVPQAMKNLLNKFMPLVSKTEALVNKADAIVAQHTAFDATQPVQFIFEKSGISRTTLKRITGLEARVFMRKDAKVLIYPTFGASGSFLRETAKNAIGEIGEAASDLATEAWKKNASSWWLINATNMNVAGI